MLSQMKLLTGNDNLNLGRNIGLGFVEALLTGLPYVFLYLVIREMFAVTPDMTLIWSYCGVMVVLFAARVIVARQVTIEGHSLGYDAGVDMRNHLAKKLKRVPMGYLLKTDPGKLNSTMLQDVTFTEQIFSHLFAQLVITISLVSLVAIGLTFEDWRLGVAMCIGLPVAVVVFTLLKRIGTRYSRALLELLGQMNGSLMEYILGIKVLRAFNLAGKRFSRLDKRLKELQHLSLKHEFIVGLAPLGFISFVELGFAVMLLTGVFLSLDGDLEPQVFVLFLIVSSRFFKPLMSIAMYLAEYGFMRQSANRIEAILQEPELKQGIISQRLTPDVKFSDVSFSYIDDVVLKHVDLHCKPGTLTALVGPSGSGKTTITSLLARFWDVDSGVISIGGKDIRHLTAECLADHISMVFQDVYLFNDTIYHNLTLGMDNPSREKVEAVCKATCCWSFISRLPDGLDSMIGEGGATLSGGEKQRLSIARAILKDAPIILLDEATASLDPENESEIQIALSELIKEKTVIMIAHRLNTIVNADQIVVLDQGEVVQCGRHEELVCHPGLYQQLWQAQQQSQGWTLATC
ncbi:ABC transporter ATP-binding protein [Photobacterium sp. J15]|uniref:ABC transporter ATP-binding protein n=1 Tax=Photobacterium sp. J15 TaxID=265901 RepID=UPI0007E3E88C|nr:ABC transporter ATP-binding protein [Photobacterium sp. J15]